MEHGRPLSLLQDQQSSSATKFKSAEATTTHETADGTLLASSDRAAHASTSWATFWQHLFHDPLKALRGDSSRKGTNLTVSPALSRQSISEEGSRPSSALSAMLSGSLLGSPIARHVSPDDHFMSTYESFPSPRSFKHRKSNSDSSLTTAAILQLLTPASSKQKEMAGASSPDVSTPAEMPNLPFRRGTVSGTALPQTKLRALLSAESTWSSSMSPPSSSPSHNIARMVFTPTNEAKTFDQQRRPSRLRQVIRPIHEEH